MHHKEIELWVLNMLIDNSLATSAHAHKGRGLLEEMVKMLNCGNVCQFSIFFDTNPTQFIRTFGAKTSLTVVF